ncbi:MAG TPA: beta-L-arabinofuranosidase domain-containing protein [Fimbriimonadaceae bacterium]|nr:beta-L-arabinofuranosidase domain-containing protein [Fimbriimonadaceae bacterium]
MAGQVARASFVTTLPSGKPNAFYVNQASPLAPTPLQKLPVGAVRGKGWLQVQLDLQRKGFSGQLEHISRFLDIKNNAWMGNGTADRAGWEELPYWLKGQISLAYVTGDQAMIAECKKWVEGILSSQKPDGWFGPESNRNTKLGTPDLWPNMLAQSLLQTYYEATGDKRVINLMSKYCDYLASLSKEQLIDPRHYWHYQRVGDQLASLVWLYNRTKESKILSLAARIHSAGNKWVDGVANRHGVNFAQGFREPATYAVFSKSEADRKATERDLNLFSIEFGQWPGGMYAADENARTGKSDPRQATESCSIAEMMFSHELLFEYSGDPTWADRAEDVAFNWLPATMTPDLKALRYLTAANMAVSDAPAKSPGIENGGPMFLMDPNDHRCCQHNLGMAWPYFTERLWHASDGNGLVASLLAPSQVTAKVGNGTKVVIDEETTYPFEDSIRFKVSPERSVKFSLAIRIPGWSKTAQIRLNGKEIGSGSGGQFAVLDREWKKGDLLEIKLPMQVETRTWAARPNTLSVYRGPLAYSLKIDEEYREVPRANGWDAYEIYPKSAWNIGLVSNPKFEVSTEKLAPGLQPWDQKHVPVELKTSGRVIPDWTLDMYGLASPLQPSPAFTAEPVRPIALIPMGAARLRVTVFPTVSPDASANHWKKGRIARRPLPTTYSHRNWFDSEGAPSDGLLPSDSGDEEIPRFTWWDHKGTQEWIQYTFPENRTFQRARVYFFDDTGKGFCRVPASWKLQVKVGGQWQDVEPIEAYSTIKDGWSEVKFKPVGGKEIRLVAQLKEGFSAGILEWEIQ